MTRTGLLAFQQILDDSLKVGIFNICLAPGATHSAEVVKYQIDVPVHAGIKTLPHQERGRSRCVRLHRAVLQRDPASFDDRIPQSC